MTVGDEQAPVVGRLADDGEGAALAFAQRAEFGQPRRRDGQHVALLRLVAPDLGRRHAGFLDVHFAQVEACAATAAVREFGQGVRQAAGADVVDRQDRVAVARRPAVTLGRAELPAAVDHFLRTPLHLRVAALHRREVEVLGVAASAHRAGGAAAEADQQAGAAELDEEDAGRELFRLEALVGGDRAEAAGDHDRLVVAAHAGRSVGVGDRLLVGAEVAGEVRPAEFVVEGGGADRAFEHDVERRGDARRLAVGHRVGFPGLQRARDLQVGDRKPAQAGLRLRAAAGGALVADLAARAGGSAREGRDRGRMVVRLDLGQDVRELLVVAVATVGRREEALRDVPLDHRRVVRIGDHRALGVRLVRLADHAEQRLALLLAVDHPGGIEDLVPAVLGVGLREHHQLDVGRVAAGAREDVDEVVDLVGRQREAEPRIGLDQRIAAAGEKIDARERLRRDVAEQRRRLREVVEDGFGHAVMQQRGDGGALIGRNRGKAGDPVSEHALDPLDRVESAVPGDVGGLRRPRRDCPQARRHQEQLACKHLCRTFREQGRQMLARGLIERPAQRDDVPVLGRLERRAGQYCGQSSLQALAAELGQRVGAAQEQGFREGGNVFGHGGRPEASW